MLPRPGTYYFPWEVSAGRVPDGASLRTFGRLSDYDVAQSRVTLLAQRGSTQHHVPVCTRLVEPFQAQVGFLYLVLGELELQQGGGALVKARVLTCVEGMNLSLLEQAIRAQRLHQRARARGQRGEAAAGLAFPGHAGAMDTGASPSERPAEAGE
ncbi:PREDICTED: CST complex subunit TEN1 [Condylura cristata]|uniref:CST complex subunit TEN1 n=1 Tax=Condylura cristata TaxID=143302 RepID=UPI000334536E|nr:PREDICTED: CST complex subunit TEN1 [Condylura cristata]